MEQRLSYCYYIVIWTDLNSIYLVRDRTFVSRAIAPKFDLDMHATQSLCHYVRPFNVHG